MGSSYYVVIFKRQPGTKKSTRECNYRRFYEFFDNPFPVDFSISDFNILPNPHQNKNLTILLIHFQVTFILPLKNMSVSHHPL